MAKFKVKRFYPKQDRIVVLRNKAEEKSAGGIIIPDTAKEKDQKGRVIEVGPEVANCKPGDTIMFAKYAGQEIEGYYAAKNHDDEYLYIRENDVSGEYREWEIDDEHINPETLKLWESASAKKEYFSKKKK